MVLFKTQSMGTLLKLGPTLARKLQNDPKIIEHLVQCAGELVTNLNPPDTPPRLSSISTESAASVSKPNIDKGIIVTPLTSIGGLSLSLPSIAHCHTLEFITEAAQELYTKGQLHIKPYARYLK